MAEVVEREEFGVQAIASGNFIDQPVEDGRIYIVKTAIVRLNPTALNAWYKAQVKDWEMEDLDTDEEIQAYIGEKKRLMMEFEGEIAKAVGFRPDLSIERINVNQIVSEVFGVAWVHRKKKGE